ncbi:MAG: tetratricopeptide repeat protein [Planctomycetes bacterium]|nr:tetratricopeptide repeat protein [Planctomycetota bacterium]
MAALVTRIVWRSSDPRIAGLPEGVAVEDYRRASDLYALATGNRADRTDVLMQLAQQAVKRGDWTAARNCLAEIPADHPRHGHFARYQAGALARRLKRYESAERAFSDFLRLEQQRRQCDRALAEDARRWLSDLLLIQLRFEERQALLRQSIARGEASVFGVLDYCFPSLIRWRNPEASALVQQCLKQDGGNHHLKVAWGRHLTANGRYEEAEAILKECCRRQPQSLRASAALVECLYERGDWSLFESRIRDLPPARPSEPWLLTRLRGECHFRNGELDEAARSFQQILEANPTDPRSHARLAHCYRQMKEGGGESGESSRPAILGRIQSRLAWVLRAPENPQPLLEIAEMCIDGGFAEQAELLVSLLGSHPHYNDFENEHARLQRRLRKTVREGG